MPPRVLQVRALGGYRLELTFTDGVRGEVDLSDWIVGQSGVIEPLKDPEYFKQVFVNSEFGTIQWPNDVDFCPDVLYSKMTGEPLPTSQLGRAPA